MKRLNLLLTLLLIFLGSVSPVNAEEVFEVDAKHAIAIEVSTGKILYEKDSQTVSGIAGTTKLLTAYIIYEALDKGDIKPTDSVAISDYAYELANEAGIANIPLDARQYSVDELLNAMLVYSANGATVALAEHVSGSEAKFVKTMSQKLKTWGITDSTLVNTTGLNNAYLGDYRISGSSEDAENQMSARSLAIIAQHLVTDFPNITERTSQLTLKWNTDELSTWNLLVKGATYSRPSVNGLATGTSDLAGSSLVTSSWENDMQVIAVVLNTTGGDSDPYARFVATNNLLEYVENTYYFWTLVGKGQSWNDSQATVFNGTVDHVTAVAKDDFNVVLKLGEKNFPLSYQAYSNLLAPIAQGQTVGHVTFEDEGYLTTPPSIEMVAKTEVPQTLFFKVWWNNFVRWVNEKL